MENFIGIDLGTTYSSIARIDEYGRPVVVKTSSGESLIPSAVYVDPSGREIAGADAKDMMQDGEEDVAVFFKRYMGNKDVSFTLGGRPYSPTDLSAILLRKIKAEAEIALGGPVEKAVITVPAYFNDLQRNETVEAARRAGLDVLRIINEPTAAAITYGVSHASQQRLLVYDLGGGTFDVTVLSVTPQSITVLATGGDHELGGKNWDDELVSYVTRQFSIDTGLDISESVEAYNDLVFNCEKLKKQLSDKESSTVTVRFQGARAKYTVTRSLFEQLTDHLLHSTKSMAEHVLSEAGLSWRDLDGVLLVGGSTRMPMVQNWVRNMSGKEPLRGVNVDEAVALGAAIQASIEMQRRSYSLGGSPSAQPRFSLASAMKIVDVMSHSLGTVALSEDGSRYVNSIIIGKNKPIPVTESKPFRQRTRPGADNELTVYLTQGESRDLAASLVVGKYVIGGIRHIGADGAVVNIGYSYDENGIINVQCTQSETGAPLSVKKVPLDDDLSWLFEKPKRSIGAPLSIIVAIDLSGSMCGTPIEKAREAAHEFVNRITGGTGSLGATRIGIMGFADRSAMVARDSNDLHAVKDAINQLSMRYPKVGFGNENNPLEVAYREFRSADSSAKKILVVLTDGVWIPQREAIEWSDRYRKERMDVIAVGFGGADRKFLERISTSSDSALLTDLDHLVESFGNIAQEISLSGGTSGLSWK